MATTACLFESNHCMYISMGYCKKDLTPLLMHWSYIFLALTHRYVCQMETKAGSVCVCVCVALD